MLSKDLIKDFSSNSLNVFNLLVISAAVVFMVVLLSLIVVSGLFARLLNSTPRTPSPNPPKPKWLLEWLDEDGDFFAL